MASKEPPSDSGQLRHALDQAAKSPMFTIIEVRFEPALSRERISQQLTPDLLRL